ncbi:MAG: S-layer homology domain-containing protein [Clostridia bacterium]|nr:S-layer homology domain-containing protein [Clostridia bacterium]
MKRFLSIILSIVTVLSILPITSMAKTEYIREVSIYNIAPPVAGKLWQGSQPAATSDAPYSVYGTVEWIDETEERILKNNEQFKIGHVYTVQIRVEVKDGYEFDSTATEYNMKGYFYSGGKCIEAKLSKAFEYQRWAMVVMSYTFPALKELEKIEYVAISDVIEPKIGRQSIAREQYLKYSENIEGINAYWLENYDWDNHFSGVFKESKRYTFVVELAPKDGYFFADTTKMVASINGRVAEVRAGSGTLLVLYEYKTGKALEKVMGIVTFDIDAPAIGAHPSFEPKDNREDGLYYLDKQHEGSTKNGVIWYEGVGNNERKMTENDTFKANENYYVAIRVRPVQGYEFDTDENGDLLVRGAINGNTAIAAGNEEAMFVGYAFTPLKEAETEKPKDAEKPSEPEKEPEKPTENPQEEPKLAFTDVPKDQYYYDAVMWAVDEGITGGTSTTTFSPDAPCTRGQVVTFLHRMIGSPEPAAIGMPFTDVNEDAYYYKSVKWALGSNITGGTSATTFSPDTACTRGQVVTFLWRTAGQPEAKSDKCDFTDVGSDSYYYKAVLWAVEQGITGGTSADTFSPDSPCTRGQVVTFLYRFINK